MLKRGDINDNIRKFEKGKVVAAIVGWMMAKPRPLSGGQLLISSSQEKAHRWSRWWMRRLAASSGELMRIISRDSGVGKNSAYKTGFNTVGIGSTSNCCIADEVQCTFNVSSKFFPSRHFSFLKQAHVMYSILQTMA